MRGLGGREGKGGRTGHGLGRDEDGGVVGVVEVRDALSRELEVLALILADGDVGCAVHEHVCCLQHRVRE